MKINYRSLIIHGIFIMFLAQGCIDPPCACSPNFDSKITTFTYENQTNTQIKLSYYGTSTPATLKIIGNDSIPPNQIISLGDEDSSSHYTSSTNSTNLFIFETKAIDTVVLKFIEIPEKCLLFVRSTDSLSTHSSKIFKIESYLWENYVFLYQITPEHLDSANTQTCTLFKI